VFIINYNLFLGGSGFIGSNLVTQFIHNNELVIIYGVNNENTKFLLDRYDSVIFIEGYLSEYYKIEKIFNTFKVKCVFHFVSNLIPSSDYNDFAVELKQVVEPTEKILQMMKIYEINKIIFISSGGAVYGDYKNFFSEEDELKPISYYGLSKLILEQIIKFHSMTQNLNYNIFRVSNPFGDFQNIFSNQGLIGTLIIRSLKKEYVTIWGDGSNIRDYIPVEVLCEYIFSLFKLNLNNQVINLASGSSYSINDIIKIINEMSNEEIKINYDEPRSTDSLSTTFNIAKLESLTYKISIDFKRYIFQYYKSIKEKFNK